MNVGRLVFLAVLATTIGLFVHAGWWLTRVWARKYRERHVNEASQSLSEIFLMVPPSVLWGVNLSTLVLFYATFSWYFGTWVLGVVGGLIGFSLPRRVIRLLRQRWLSQVEEQLPEALAVLANSLRAGLGFSQALALVAKESPRPISFELTRALREEQMGTPLTEVMRHLAERVKTEEARLLASAVGMTIQTGGKLADVLSTLAGTIRERQRLRGKISALTAQGRMQARVVAVMPFAVWGIMFLFEKEMMLAPFAVMVGPISLGRIVLAIVLLLEFLAFLWVRKILAVDI